MVDLTGELAEGRGRNSVSLRAREETKLFKCVPVVAAKGSFGGESFRINFTVIIKEERQSNLINSLFSFEPLSRMFAQNKQ